MILMLFFWVFSSITAEHFQRATQLDPQRVEMNAGLNNSYADINQLKREVDSYKQRQQEIVSFNQVSSLLDDLVIFRIENDNLP